MVQNFFNSGDILWGIDTDGFVIHPGYGNGNSIFERPELLQFFGSFQRRDRKAD